MTATEPSVPAIEPAATMADLKRATGWSEPTIHQAIRQGVLPGTAFQAPGSSRYTYSVPMAALRAWMTNPRQFTVHAKPGPTAMVRRIG